jgi:CRISPR-associated protein Cas2
MVVKMYVIIVYDVGVERVNNVRKFLRQYLMWRQNSVFEGELTKAEYEKVKKGVRDIIDEELDLVIFYSVRDKKFLKEEKYGAEKANTGNII